MLKKNLRKVIRVFRNKANRRKLRNHNFTLISSNCNGAFIMNELGVKFNTPTVNLFFYPNDFIKFLENFDEYLLINLEENLEKSMALQYPVGILNDIEVHFMHYDSFEIAKEKWEERCKRIDKKNIFIMSTDRDGCTYDIIKRFDKLKFDNKVIFTRKEYKEFESAFYIDGFENEKEVGLLFEFEGYLGKKYYDRFNFVNWFNNNKS
ncbi:MAG: DUF1919 domain-containing protein [Romboutsia sp.]